MTHKYSHRSWIYYFQTQLAFYHQSLSLIRWINIFELKAIRARITVKQTNKQTRKKIMKIEWTQQNLNEFCYRCFDILDSFGLKIRKEQLRHSTHGTRNLFGRIATAARKSFEISFHRTWLMDIFKWNEGDFYGFACEKCQSIYAQMTFESLGQFCNFFFFFSFFLCQTRSFMLEYSRLVHS